MSTLALSLIVVGAIVVLALFAIAIGFVPELRRYIHIRKM
jgi:hypothetical protein